MALREFTDRGGREWRVWDTHPKAHGAGVPSRSAKFLANAERLTSEGGELPAAPQLYTPGREGGWLTFTCGPDKRRLSPIPGGWETASAAELETYLGRAETVDAVNMRVGDTKRER
jgi:hypothetical protein